MKKDRLKKVDPFLAALLLCAAVFLVLKSLRLDSLSQWMDEGFYSLAAEKIRALGYPLYPSGHVLFKSIFFSYLLAFFSLFAGLSTESLRLLSVLLHTATPIVLYLTLKKIVRKEVLFAAGLLLFFSLWQTEYARLVLYFVPAQLFVFLGAVLFFKSRFLEKGGRLYILAWVAALLTHQLAIALAFCFASLLLLEPRRFFSKKNLLSLAAWIPVFLFVQLQEVLLWGVGQAYSTEGVSSLKETLAYFFKGFSLAYLKILRKSYPAYSALFFVGSFLFIAVLRWKKFKKVERTPQEKFMAFFMLNFILTVLFLGFMRTHEMPRYLFPFILQMFLLNSYYLFSAAGFLFRFVVRPRLASLAGLAAALLFPFLLAGDVGWRNVVSVVGREYVDQIRSDIITTSGRHFAEDHKSPGEFVRRNLKEGDRVLAMHMVFQYLYAGQVDGFVFSGGPGTWDAGEFVNGRWQDVYLGVPWIRTADELKDYLSRSIEHGRRIWLITSPSAERRDHIEPEIQAFLRENRRRVLWTGKDGVSKAYLFDGQEPRGRYYEAEWGIPGRGRIIDRDNLSLESTVALKGPYRTSFLPLERGEQSLGLKFRESEGRKVEIRLKHLKRILMTWVETVSEGSITLDFRIKRPTWYYFEVLPLDGQPVFFDYLTNQKEEGQE